MNQEQKDFWEDFGDIPIGYCPSEYISWPQFVKLMGVDEAGMVPQLYRINDYLTQKYGALQFNASTINTEGCVVRSSERPVVKITEGNIKRGGVNPPPTTPKPPATPVGQGINELNRAIDNFGDGIDTDTVLEDVKERLGDFGE